MARRKRPEPAITITAEVVGLPPPPKVTMTACVAVRGRRPRPGPRPGTIDRNGPICRALVPEMKDLVRKHGSLRRAARELVDAGKFPGAATPESKANILRGFFSNHLKKHKKYT
jgi:hypothetical protein